MTATAAQAEPEEGTLVVNVVDQFNRSVTGVIQLVDSDGSIISGEDGPPAAASKHVFTVPVGGYAMQSITPWGGFECVGLSTCTPVGGSPVVTPVATVAAGTTTTYTFRSTMPSITGGNKVGSTLTIRVPPGLTALHQYLAASGPYAGLGASSFTQQWLRSGAQIPGATARSYKTVVADGSRSISAQLEPSPGQVLVFSTVGIVAQPFRTNAIAMRKFARVKTTTKVKVPKRFKASERVTMTVKVKAKGKRAAKAGVLKGSVIVKIGRYKARKKLHKGRAFVNLPKLSTGKHTIKVSYQGSATFAKSKAKKVKVRVRAGR